MIARRLLLLVALVVFLVDDDQPQVLHRREHAGSRGHHDGSLPGANAPPFLGAFGILKRGVQNGHALAETMVKLTGDGGRQRDLGNQQKRAAAQRQGRFDRVQVDFGLAGSGDAFEQKRLKLLRREPRLDRIEGRSADAD